jgi:hypothetical protein
LTYFQDFHNKGFHEISGTSSDEVRYAQSFNYNAPHGDDNLLSRVAASDNVEKIWPHLEELVDRYQELQLGGIIGSGKGKELVDEVRRAADDLRDPDVADEPKGAQQEQAAAASAKL